MRGLGARGPEFDSRISHPCFDSFPFRVASSFNPLATRDLAEKHVLKLVEGFFGHCRAV